MIKHNTELKDIPIEFLVRGKYQPRNQFDPVQLEELAQSIRENGLIQPIIVRPLAEKRYEIIAGERRWRAAQLAQLSTITCLIKWYSDEQSAAVTTVENIQRQDLNPIEEAEAYERLIREFKYTHEEIAIIVGKCRSKITNLLRLLRLHPTVKNNLIENKLTEGHGKVLAGLSEKQQIVLSETCIAKGWNVRQLEHAIKKLSPTSLPPMKDTNVKHLEKKLSEHIGCKAEIDFNNLDRQGNLIINFHNLEALEGILSKMQFKYE